MADIKKLAEELVKLTILEANELKEHLKEEYGIEPAAVAVAATAGAADAADEQTEFTVTLKDAGAQKVAVIKAVKEKVSKDEAEEAKKKLEEAGATVELA